MAAAAPAVQNITPAEVSVAGKLRGQAIVGQVVTIELCSTAGRAAPDKGQGKGGEEQHACLCLTGLFLGLCYGLGCCKGYLYRDIVPE